MISEYCNYPIVEDFDHFLTKVFDLRNNELKSFSRKQESKVDSSKRHGNIQNYQFFNDHVLRAAVSRVVGLVNVLELENKELEKTETFNLLLKSCDELESVMQKASHILNTNNYSFRDEDI